MHSNLHLRAFARAALLVGVLLTQACTYYTLKEDPAIMEERFRANPPESLAVLPVRNATKKTGIDETVRRGLYRGLSPLHYRDVELKNVDEAVAKRSMAANVAPEELKPSEFRQSPPADALLYAEVFKVSKFWLFFYSHIRIGLDLKMIDARSQEVLYTNRAVLHKRLIDLPTSIQGLLGSTVFTIWNLRDSELEPASEEFGRRVSESFPNPPRLAAGGTVGITAVFVSPDDAVLRAGDKLSVEVWGTPGAVGSFDIGGQIKGLPLYENAPGRYSGVYTVVPGDVAPGVVQAHLETSGEVVTMSNVEGDFQIDAVPPGRPEIRSVDFSEGGLTLSLGLPRAEPGLSFEIYRAQGDDTRHEFRARVEELHWTDRRVDAGATYSYIVKAVDPDGAVSQVSVPRRVQIPPRGPVELAGSITTRLVLHPFSNPYIITGNVVVEETGSIEVRPDTEIHVAGGSRLILKGPAVFDGSPDDPIQVRGQPDTVLIAWEPREDTATLRMEHVVFRQASTGLLVRRGNVAMDRCRLENAHTGMFLSAGTSAQLSGCVFRNLEQGIMGEPQRLDVSFSVFHRLPNAINVNTAEVVLRRNNFSGQGVAVQQRGPWEVRLDGNWLDGGVDHLNLLRRLQGPCVFETLNRKPSADGEPYVPFPGSYEECITGAERAWAERRWEWALREYLRSWWRHKDRDVGLRLIRLLGRSGLLGTRYSEHPDMETLDRREHRSEAALCVARTLAAMHPGDPEVLREYARLLDKAGDSATARLWRERAESLEARVESPALKDDDGGKTDTPKADGGESP